MTFFERHIGPFSFLITICLQVGCSASISSKGSAGKQQDNGPLEAPGPSVEQDDKVAASVDPTVDSTPPAVVLSSIPALLTDVAPIKFFANFSEAVSGFDLSDISVSNGTALQFSGSLKNYQFDVKPAGDGPVTVNVAAGVAVDVDGNLNLAADPVTRVFDSTAPTPVGVVSVTEATGTGLTLSWDKASDAASLPAKLQYQVRQSPDNNIGTLENADANGVIVKDFTSDIDLFIVTGLQSSSTYYFNVVVKDELGYRAVYGSVAGSTLDVTPPVVSAAGLTSSAVEIDDGAVTLSWQEATDNLTESENLLYDVYYSINPNLDTLANIKINGTKSGTVTGLTSYKVPGLTIDKDYFFNVVARDVSGNEAAYTMRKPFCGGNGIVGDEWLVCDPGSLQFIALHLTGAYQLAVDIDLSDAKNWNGANGFKPIGTNAVPFLGSLDGNSKVISNLYIMRSQSYVGLFGGIGTGATVEYLNLRDAVVSGTGFGVGVLAGVSSGSIQGVLASGYVKGEDFVGGMIGDSSFGSVTECGSSALVEGNIRVGGLIGRSTTPVSRSFATGQVKAVTGVAGGLIGVHTTNGDVEDSYATGHVYSAGGLSVAGFIGSFSSNGHQVVNSYASGNVFLDAAATGSTGGFIGRSALGTVNGVFAAGNVFGPITAGSVVGEFASGSLNNIKWFSHPFNPSNCYVTGNTNCTSQTNSTWFYNIANYDGGGGELNWDFSPNGAWIMPQTGKFPVLRWQNPNEPIAFPPEFRNGRKIGFSDMAAYKVWGFCGAPGATISFTGPNAPADTTCNGGTWTTTWDFSSQLDGPIVINVKQGSDLAIERTLAKDTDSCGVGLNDETIVANIDARFAVSSGPHVICNRQQIARVQSVLTNYLKSFVIGTNIDMTGYSSPPIGNNTNLFKGAIDGDGFFLSNLSITNSAQFTGFVGFLSLGGELKNIGLENINILGRDDTGGLVGNTHTASANIQNVYTTGFVGLQTFTIGNAVGGIVGTPFRAVMDSFSTADVVGLTRVGGLAGNLGPGGSVTRSFSRARILGDYYVGGLVGSTSFSSPTQSYFVGTVSGKFNSAGSGVGGVLGYSSSAGISSDCYAIASVYGKDGVGGVIGESSSASIQNSYASGQVFGATKVGGIVGSLASTFTSSYSFSIATVSAASNSSIGSLIGETSASTLAASLFGLAPLNGLTCIGTDNGAAINCGNAPNTAYFSSAANPPLNAWDFDVLPKWRFPASGGLPILYWQQEN